jgi:hypothetical protein
VIQHPGVVIVGRHEAPVETAERYLVRSVAEHAFQAYVALQRGMRAQIRETVDAVIGRSPDQRVQVEDVFWGAWNAVACVGRFGAWDHLDFLEICHLGVTPAPWVTRRWRFVPRLDQTDMLPLGDGLSAPVVYGSSQLVTEGFLRTVVRSVRSPVLLPSSAMDRLKMCEKELVKLGVDVHPHAQTRYGLRELLAQLGYRMLPPNEVWVREGDDVPWGLTRLTTDELQLQLDEPRLPHSSTTGRPWTTLDDALARGMGKIDPRAP